MKVLRKGIQGTDVRRWQYFLAGQGYPVIADGKFGDGTDRYTKEFQAAHGLKADGEVGTFSYRKAIELGFNFQLNDPTGQEETSLNWPPKPGFQPLSGIQSKFALFGKFDYRIIPEDPDGRIQILGNWEQENIVNVEIPSLRNVAGAPSSGRIRFHKKAVSQLVALFQAWEQAGLIHLIETWSGSYYPRLVRGSSSSLSNHSFGTAFDINVAWNGLNIIPPIVGKKGSVRALVPLANQHGFYWGGHFNSRLDGMHFEVAKNF
jgi:peptidoglycan hydrolase-like protein with peptidoglycan-binding domain